MTKVRATFAFDLVIMLGDNMYGGQSAADYVKKFEQPYALLLAAGVKFQASLGNHDRPDQVGYKLYNMNGQRYYTYARNNVRFFALDSNLMDREAARMDRCHLRDAREDWKICYFHHPLYSNAARHGSSVDLRVLLEPISSSTASTWCFQVTTTSTSESSRRRAFTTSCQVQPASCGRATWKRQTRPPRRSTRI